MTFLSPSLALDRDKLLTIVFGLTHTLVSVQFEAAFGESSRQPVSRPIRVRLSFYAHIWQERRGGAPWWGYRPAWTIPSAIATEGCLVQYPDKY